MTTLIYNATIINENHIFTSSILIENQLIKKIYPNNKKLPKADQTIDATGLYLIPGAIDTHVHFRQPGLEYKATIETESKAALVGGVTSFVDMPNTKPPTTDEATLEEKLKIAAQNSWANYGFYVAVTDDNFKSINQIAKKALGIKLFYGATTGNLLFNDAHKIKELFATSSRTILIHSEKQQLLDKFKATCTDQNLSKIQQHFDCRPNRVCIEATKELANLAEQTSARLHFLHITTHEEIEFLNSLNNNNITYEICPHYLWFSIWRSFGKDELLKANPAIKTENDRQKLVEAATNLQAFTIGSDHAPHLLAEKLQPYDKAPSGLPSIQHFLPSIFTIFEHNLSIIPTLTAHNPAKLLNITRRGYIRPGYYADLVLIAPHPPLKNIYHKCGWSIFEGLPLKFSVFMTFVNGKIAFFDGKFTAKNAKPLTVATTP